MTADRLPTYAESVLSFGRDEHLSGVLTRVSSRQGAAASPLESADERLGVLLLNAGVIARVGPHRFNVKLARALARHRLPVLRFDVSGQGDSATPADALPHAKQVTDDIVHAIDVMQSEAHVEQVLIVGICSGANQGWAAALIDPRIAGLVMIDPYAYPTRKTLAKYHWRRMRLRGAGENLAVLGRAMRARARSLLQDVSNKLTPRRSPKSARHTDDSETPLSSHDYVQGMQRLVDRGVSLLLVYTGTWSRHYSYPEQFADRFGSYPFSAQVLCEYVPQFDHTLTLVTMQQKMIRRIESWIELVLAQRQLARTDPAHATASPATLPAASLVDGK